VLAIKKAREDLQKENMLDKNAEERELEEGYRLSINPETTKTPEKMEHEEPLPESKKVADTEDIASEYSEMKEKTSSAATTTNQPSNSSLSKEENEHTALSQDLESLESMLNNL
jgi:hypothetical protein